LLLAYRQAAQVFDDHLLVCTIPAGVRDEDPIEHAAHVALGVLDLDDDGLFTLNG
jgi:hypothetical protein